MPGIYVALGQPIYIEGMFFGSEFPDTDNQILSNTAYVRYYSGKSFQKFTYEKRLDDNGTFTTWPNVIGATASISDMNTIQTDFFAYIHSTVARPSKFRLQFNSWYDWQMNINSERIISSLKEMERGFSQHGLRPIDSYVVDDGWNAYGNHDDSKTSPNKSDFWDFNNKFPNGFTEPAKYAQNVCSKFGLWLGPRGGYDYQGDWGRWLEAKGTGTYNKNSGDVVTNDSVYLGRLLQLMTKFQDDYDINYWKLDGFMNQVPQASTNGRYITGGTNNMYYVTEHWERWNILIDSLYKNAAGRGTDLWINLTSYVTPSPWMLRMGNSVWLQASGDNGDLNLGRGVKAENQISYRDDVYYDLINNRQLQFPISSFFHHDPCFGKIVFSKNSTTDDQLRMYLYMIAMRGSSFWDMLYSYNLLDETNKWMVNTEALQFAENYKDVLSNSKMIGSRPNTGKPYGFSAWNQTSHVGIVAVRNASATTQNMTVDLTSSVGVPVGVSGLHRSVMMEYLPSQTNENNDNTFAYGDQITVTLQPGEVRIWKFDPNKDVTPPTFVLASSDDDSKTITVKFSEPVKAGATNFTVKDNQNNTIAVSNAEIGADYKTVTLTTQTALTINEKYNVIANGVKDWNGNAVTENLSSPAFYSNANGVITSAVKPADLKNGSAVAVTTATVNSKSVNMMTIDKEYTLLNTKGFSGKGAFNLSFALNTGAASATLVKQGTDLNVSLTGGKIQFTAGNLTATSTVTVNDAKNHLISCCREANGMIKIYVDTLLNISAYDSKNISPAIAEEAVTIGGGTAVQMGFVSLVNRAFSFKEQSLLPQSTESLLSALIAQAKTALKTLTAKNNTVGYYSTTLATELNKAVTTIEPTLTQDVDQTTRLVQEQTLKTALSAYQNSLQMPMLCTDSMLYFYRFYTPDRDNRYPISTGSGKDLTGAASTSATTNTTCWRFVKRADGSIDIINRDNNTYISPAANNNTALQTTAAQPAAGWKFAAAATAGRLIVVSGSSQMNQTQSGLGWKVYNWGSGSNTTDGGCQYAFAFVDSVKVTQSGIENLSTTQPGFILENGKIKVAGSNKPVTVTTLSGQKTNGENLTPGIYIATFDGKSYKFLLK